MDEKTNKPICPYCNTTMTLTNYEGYYDHFSYWACECDDEDLEDKCDDTHTGAYN